ncbi:MAG: 2-oxoacid:ferredoxin oxidoreductase subunit beta [Chloroflexi bacterium]|nr:2-oxoacid:ferredoxin oxidoreductase subunit beta [Chloroflexota bacterium]
MTEHAIPPEHEYLRPNKKFPTVWCPGCGIGVVLGAIIRAVGRLKLDKNQVALVSGIGCSGRMAVYVDFDALHTTHGRALAFATGLKMVRPEMKVIVVMGDGDALAIGGNHFIHAARRNIDLTAIVINNFIYGMTGGQLSPTTRRGDRATTATYGHVEAPLDAARIAEAAGAAFVARSTVYHAVETERLVAQAIEKKGFALVEVLSNCHTYYGRLNKQPTPTQMLRWFRDSTIPVGAQKNGGEEKIVRGVLVDRELPEFTEEYQKLIARAQGKKTDEPLRAATGR